MASVKQCGLIAGLLLIAQVGISGELSPPPDVFARAPASRRVTWWRPEKVVFNPYEALSIQRQIDQLSLDQVSTISLDAAFGVNANSAFLPCILATKGEKGLIILERLLEPYRKGRKLDNKWLIAVAAVGRVPTPRAKQVLLEHLKWLLGRWSNDIARQVRGLYAPIAVVDALVASAAMEGSITARYIDSIAQICASQSDRVRREIAISGAWELGLEWAQEFLPEPNLLKTVSDALHMCDDTELRRSMEMTGPSARLLGIRDFLLSSKDSWSVVEKLLRSSATDPQARPRVREFLVTQYMHVLTQKARLGKGTYPLDEQVIGSIVSMDIDRSSELSFSSKVLLACRPSMADARWEAFLSRHAADLDPKEAGPVDTVIRLIHGTNEFGPHVATIDPNIFDRRSKKDSVSRAEPGVYMMGFSGAPIY